MLSSSCGPASRDCVGDIAMARSDPTDLAADDRSAGRARRVGSPVGCECFAVTAIGPGSGPLRPARPWRLTGPSVVRRRAARATSQKLIHQRTHRRAAERRSEPPSGSLHCPRLSGQPGRSASSPDLASCRAATGVRSETCVRCSTGSQSARAIESVAGDSPGAAAGGEPHLRCRCDHARCRRRQAGAIERPAASMPERLRLSSPRRSVAARFGADNALVPERTAPAAEVQFER